MKIYTRYVPRTKDWSAWYDGCETSGPYGWGETEQQAIDDLVINHPDMRIVEALQGR